MILFRTLLNRNLWMNPLSNVMGGWGIWKMVNGEQKLTTECIENVIMMIPFTSIVMPGLKQEIKVTHVELPESARKELDERFVLIYTGQRRLARNLLRDVVGRYVGNEPDSLFALEEIQKTAALMRFELERGNVDGFAKLLDYHWELSKKVDAGSSNTLIEQIFSSIEEMIDGRLVCGAGGGGFLQVILKKGITREDVEKRLNEVFMDSLVGVADCKLVW